MATYTETFTGQTIGSNSTTFTDRYDAESYVSVENPAIGEQDSRVLKFGSSDTGPWIFQSFDSVDGDANRADCEILMRYRIGSDTERHAIATARASGSGGSETCYIAYVNGDDFTIGRFVSGSGAALASTPTETFPESHFIVGGGVDNFAQERANEWHWCRFRVNGTGATVTLQAKWWVDGYDEPSEWTIDTTDTSASRITSAGWTGFSKRNFTGDSFLDFFGVGTNGDTAVNVDDTQTHRVTSVYAQAITDQDETARVTSVYAQAITDQDETARVTSVYAQVLRQTSVPVAATGQSVQCIIMT
jgi:hypothetical protein